MRRTLNPTARFSFLSKAALAALAACLALRWGVSLLTEFKTIFPDYYYTDARLYDKGARELLEAWETDSEPNVPVAPSHSLYVLSTAALYQAFGAQPFAPQDGIEHCIFAKRISPTVQQIGFSQEGSLNR